MLRITLAVVMFAPAIALAQPPGGPAKKLYIRNSTDVAATFDIVRHEGNDTITTSVVLLANQDIELTLKQIKGDRVLIAGSGKTNQPWIVYGMSEFNAHDHPFPTIGFVLLNESGSIKLVMLLQGGVGNKALPEKAKGKSIEEKAEKK